MNVVNRGYISRDIFEKDKFARCYRDQNTLFRIISLINDIYIKIYTHIYISFNRIDQQNENKMSKIQFFRFLDYHQFVHFLTITNISMRFKSFIYRI